MGWMDIGSSMQRQQDDTVLNQPKYIMNKHIMSASPYLSCKVSFDLKLSEKINWKPKIGNDPNFYTFLISYFVLGFQYYDRLPKSYNIVW